MDAPLTVAVDDPLADDVRMLLDGHLADMRATSPSESVHALGSSGAAHSATTGSTRTACS